ncbi:MAG: hypothetical protein JJE29_00390 [Peptostreptococcaceae bacterium]|nr:hypothetical protein [Peptostreptococcaceae bacterium]
MSEILKCRVCDREFEGKSAAGARTLHERRAHGIHFDKDGNKEEVEKQAPRKEKGDCEHVWQLLTSEELGMVDSDGKTLREHGYVKKCKKCWELK